MALTDIGIIPARAGFTPGWPTPSPRASDHPRSRGVYGPHTGSAWCRRGSSPLARGLRSDALLLVARLGIIPARAGFTRPVEAVPVQGQDHPRSRGVYPPTRSGGRRRPGSSPLARGLRLITPPRARCGPGSSPLARGLRWAPPCATMPAGIIPARAGFTFSPDGGGALALGSSPLARGLPPKPVGLMELLRIIPARAGFTASAWTSATCSSDHPRSRGVYAPSAPLAAASAGSSPLARGLRALHPVGSASHRIIPARAGFTATTI